MLKYFPCIRRRFCVLQTTLKSPYSPYTLTYFLRIRRIRLDTLTRSPYMLEYFLQKEIFTMNSLQILFLGYLLKIYEIFLDLFFLYLRGWFSQKPK
jgi:hypothetical protein